MIMASCSSRNSTMYDDARVWQDRLYAPSYNVTLSVLIDGKTSTGGWGSAGLETRNHWIQESFVSSTTADTVYIGGGNIPSWGTAQGYGPFELSIFNESSGAWKAVKELPGLSGEGIYNHSFPRQSSRFWRLYNTIGWAATTEFRLEDRMTCK